MDGTCAPPSHLVRLQNMLAVIDTPADLLVHSARFGRFILTLSSSCSIELNSCDRRHTAALEQMRHRHALESKELGVLKAFGLKRYVRRCTGLAGGQTATCAS